MIVFEIHRLKGMGFSNNQIAHDLGICRKSIRLYLKNPERRRGKRVRVSKLDPYKALIEGLLKDHPDVLAPVVMRHIQQEGFTGEITIVRDYLKDRRGEMRRSRAFIRFESLPGKQMQVDWGHFGTITYGNKKRKLYAFAVIESYSRMLYVEFTHSQRQEVLHQCLINAFTFLGGCPLELVVDNMLTAVTERRGIVVRFNNQFLDFLRPLKITPVACNVRQPQEKGKIEKSISYLRNNFWPLRTFKDLRDINSQVRVWLDEVANVRIHNGTGEKPSERFVHVRLNTLPDTIADYRETLSVLSHKDISVRFDSNAYTVPPWTVGKRLILKADTDTVSIYYKDKTVAVHARCWESKKRIENPSHAEQVRRLQKKLWMDRDIALFASMGDEAVSYLKALADASQPIKKNVSRLLSLKDEYGVQSLLSVIAKALRIKAYGADYIKNILYQEMNPKRIHPPVKLEKEELNEIRLSEPSLAEYDALAVKRSTS
jgi:transposase